MGSKEILEEERKLSFKEFNHEDALKIGLMIIDRVRREKLRRIGVRILLGDLLVFQYLMDEKNEDIWLKRKQNTVEKIGHSSYYVYLKNEEENIYSELMDNDFYAVCGGGFPIIINGKNEGVMCVSGLTHDMDNMLITDALKEYRRERVK